ncbi:MAG: molybdenum cofactor guanylyltransferase, partial [Rhodothermales bacterium]
MHPDLVTGLILAGGQSRRFGSEKARYPVAGRPMMVHVIEAVSSVTAALLLSVREDTAGWLHHAFPGVRTVTDRYDDAGPLAGLHAGLMEATTPWVLAVACDMPFVTADVLRRLLD